MSKRGRKIINVLTEIVAKLDPLNIRRERVNSMIKISPKT